MSDQYFKSELQLLAGLSEAKKAHGTLVDVGRCRHKIGPHIHYWRIKNLSTRYSRGQHDTLRVPAPARCLRPIDDEPIRRRRDLLSLGFQQRRSGHGLVDRDATGKKWSGSLAKRDRWLGQNVTRLLRKQSLTLLPVDAALRALADPTRRQILALVWDEECPAGEIAGHFPLTRPAISQHLTVLFDSKLIAVRQAGTRRLYQANREELARLRSALDVFWDGRLHRLKAAAERAQKSRGKRQ